MKIILLADDKKLGKQRDIIEVADSYARNVLIPKKIALPATKENLKTLEDLKRKEELEYLRNLEEATTLQQTLNKLPPITIVRKSQNGKLFGSITTKDVLDALESLNIISELIKKQNIVLPNKINQTGSYNCVVKLFRHISADITLDIVSA